MVEHSVDSSGQEENGSARHSWLRPKWTDLRASIGELRFLRVSYAFLIAMPVAVGMDPTLIQYLGLDSWPMKIAYSANLLLAGASLAYDVGCPYYIKRFQTTGDLYRLGLETKELSVHVYPKDVFKADLATCKTNFESANLEGPRVRTFCALAFRLSMVLFAVAFVWRTARFYFPRGTTTATLM